MDDLQELAQRKEARLARQQAAEAARLERDGPPAPPVSDEDRWPARLARQAAAQAAHLERWGPPPPPLSDEERRAARLEREARMPEVRAALFEKTFGGRRATR
jgi:hypothetical protein